MLTLLHSKRPKLHRVLAVLSATGLTLLHSEWPKLYGVLDILSAIGLIRRGNSDNSGIIFLISEQKHNYVVSLVCDSLQNCTEYIWFG